MKFKLIGTFLLLVISFQLNAIFEADTTLQKYRYSGDHSVADSLLEKMGHGNHSANGQHGLPEPICSKSITRIFYDAI